MEAIFRKTIETSFQCVIKPILITCAIFQRKFKSNGIYIRARSSYFEYNRHKKPITVRWKNQYIYKYHDVRWSLIVLYIFKDGIQVREYFFIVLSYMIIQYKNRKPMNDKINIWRAYFDIILKSILDWLSRPLSIIG